VHGAVALAEFADVDGVPAGLAAVTLNPELPLDLRYSAFTSLQRAGPDSACVAFVRQLLADEELGAAARSLLSAWRIENPDDDFADASRAPATRATSRKEIPCSQ
jgi:hypothetical protein